MELRFITAGASALVVAGLALGAAEHFNHKTAHDTHVGPDDLTQFQTPSPAPIQTYPLVPSPTPFHGD